MAAPGGGGRYGILAPAVQARLFALFDQGSVSLRWCGKRAGAGGRACRGQGQRAGERRAAAAAGSSVCAVWVTATHHRAARYSVQLTSFASSAGGQLRQPASRVNSQALSNVSRAQHPPPRPPPAAPARRPPPSPLTLCAAPACSALLCSALGCPPICPPCLPTVLSSGF